MRERAGFRQWFGDARFDFVGAGRATQKVLTATVKTGVGWAGLQIRPTCRLSTSQESTIINQCSTDAETDERICARNRSTKQIAVALPL